MTFPGFLPRWILPALLGSALASASAQLSDDQQVRVQITELGLMRTLLLMENNSDDLEDNVAQQLVDKDFRVFPDSVAVGSRVSPEEMRAAGERANADLIVYAKASDRLKHNKSGFLLHEGEATVQVYSRVSGELLVTKTARANGKRTTDEVEAQRSARERAMDAAAREAIERSLSKAHKIIVHEAVIVNVFSDSALLAIMEYIGKMEGVYSVKRLSFDRRTNEALIEIIGAPHTDRVWRAYLEKLPKTKVNVQITPNGALRNKYPDWFRQNGR